MALSMTQYGYIIDPMVPFTDDKGKTIKNGFVRVFVAGSSTPVVTYRNFDGATNQDRIELDNSGRTMTSVIGSKGLTYKVCVYDQLHSQESPILTVDKVPVIGTNITAGTGATVITGLDGLTTKPDGFVDASVVGTDGYVALDHTLVTDDLDTDAKATAVEDDRYIPLLNEVVNDPDSKITLGCLWQWVLGKIKSLSTSITAFRTGDVIPVDGPDGTAKMSKDDLLRETSENALGSIHSLSDTATEADLVSGNYLALDGNAGPKKLPAEDIAKRNEAVFFYNDKVNSYIKELYVVSDRTPKYVQLTQGASILWLRVLDSDLTMIAQFDTAYNGVVKWTQKAADTTDAWAVLTDVPNFGVPWGESYPEIIRSCEIMNCPIIKAHFMDDGVLVDAKDYTDEQITEVEEEIGDIYTTVYTNLEPTMNPALSMLTFKPILDDDHYNYVMDSSGYGESGTWVYMGFKITEVWKKNHSYFIAIDLEVVTDSKTTGGNFYGKLRAKGQSSSYSVSNEVTPVAGVVNGTRGNLKGFFTINDNIDTYTNADNFILQAGKYTSTESLELNVYNVCVIDMGIEGREGYKSYEEVDALFNLYGYADVAKMIANCNHAIKADVAKTVESMAVGGDIDLWGDSLVAQNYGAIVGTILGRTVISHGFGGKKSAYIRDQFLAYSNKNNTIVINVGRNDTGAGNADIVFQNIAAMVAAIPHQRFLICCPPNGNYANEGKGGTTYKFFEDLEERLAKAYPANFLNSRENTIFAYDMGDVKLTASFTKPALNGSVTISVSDASFLTTYNAADVNRWGETNAKKVAIGHTIDACDIYSVTAHDDVNNTLTLTLLESNSDVASGNTFENYTNEGAVNYARVLQYFDYTCWNDDRTQSTFRSDGIHMSAYGKDCIAKVLARKIYEMHI